jgi:hypothetical protein
MSLAWSQFLIGKRRILSDYERAREHALSTPVQTHHGVVGEAAVRSWLRSFLPRRYGVTAGYIRGQRQPSSKQLHFDVIVYDALEAPILWTEDNHDRSSGGASRTIPAEYVRAIIEVKAAFTSDSVTQTIKKFEHLESFVADIDPPSERYPTFLPGDVVIVPLFIELRAANKSDVSAMARLCEMASGFKRIVYGPVLLSGDGRPADEAAIVALVSADNALPELRLPQGLLAHVCLAPSSGPSLSYQGFMLNWSELNFSFFAFDLLALMNGTYRRGLASSFHGLDLPAVADGAKPE